MSSAVNKSSTRFVPKHAVRGTARKQPRKLSIVASKDEYARLPGLTASDGFSMRRASKSQASTDKETLFIPNETRLTENESAIADDDEPAPAKAPKVRRLDRTAKIERPVRSLRNQSEDIIDTPNDHSGLEEDNTARNLIESRNLERESRNKSINVEENEAENTESILRLQIGNSAVNRVEYEDSNVFFDRTEPSIGTEKSEDIREKDLIVNADDFTMAEMCYDLQMGQVSSKHDRFMEVLGRRRMEKNALRRKRNRARTNPQLLYQFRTELQQRDSERRQQTQNEAQEKLALDADKSSAPVLQLRMGAGGTFALDVESTIVDRHRNNGEGQDLLERREADDLDKIINSASYSRHERSERWDKKETDEFYKAISMWGTDFNMISKLFPGRSRRQIKSKYKLEEKKNPAKLHLATIRKLPIDMEEYTGLLELQDIQMMDVADVENAVQNIQNEFQQRMKEGEMAKGDSDVVKDQKEALSTETPKNTNDTETTKNAENAQTDKNKAKPNIKNEKKT